MALYFTVFPQEIAVFEKEVEIAEQEHASYQMKLREEVDKFLNSCSKKELINYLWKLFDQSPDWIYEQFLRKEVLPKRYLTEGSGKDSYWPDF